MKNIDRKMVNQVNFNYNHLLDVVSMAQANPMFVVQAIDNLRDSLSAIRMDIDPDPRAQINRAGGYDKWVTMTKEERESV
jgi:hypothetical protein